MPLLLRQGDALDAALKNALNAALTAATKLDNSTERAVLSAQIASLRMRAGDGDGAKAARERALDTAQKLRDDAWKSNEERLDLAVYLAKAGSRTEADKIIAAALQKAQSEEILGPGMRAEVAAALHKLGDDKAARELTRKLLVASAPEAEQPDEVRFHLAVYDLALFGDPDGAEALLPKVKDPMERWATFREIARLRGKTDKARGVAAMKRCLGIWLPGKDKSASNAPGLVNVMRQIGQSAEARALVERLPTLFPKKEDRDQVLEAQAVSYGLLRLFPQALAAAGKISRKPLQSGVYFELADAALAADDLASFDRLMALALKGPEASAVPGLALFLQGLRTVSQARLGKRTEAAAALEKVTAGLNRLPDVRATAGLLTTVCEAILTPPTK